MFKWSRPGFLRMGVTAAVFNSAGTMAQAKLQFMNGATSRTHFLSRTVGVGSSRQDVELDFTIRSLMATGVVRVKVERGFDEWAGPDIIKLESLVCVCIW